MVSSYHTITSPSNLPSDNYLFSAALDADGHRGMMRRMKLGRDETGQARVTSPRKLTMGNNSFHAEESSR